MCGSTFVTDDPLTRAFRWSILFLIASPYAVLAAAAGWLLLAHRRGPRHRRATVVELAQLRGRAPEPTGGDAP
jgi:hypothetical protein